MIYGVKIAVDKSLSHEQKEAAWELVASYDLLMRKCGVDLVTWTVIDIGRIYMIVGMVPGDYEPELNYAKDIMNAEIDDIAGDVTIQPADPEDIL